MTPGMDIEANCLKADSGTVLAFWACLACLVQLLLIALSVFDLGVREATSRTCLDPNLELRKNLVCHSLGCFRS